MGWMSDVTIESIVKDIDKKIEIESLKNTNPQQVNHIVEGLKMAKEIVESHY
ncbi:hypothetical protein [Bacillus paranthracis]|uniref:hypothetical protein n=1 Tax=Bacillus cereus group TaxID=86661 RepID=UPI00202CB443|nr:hypothetical protein [Bacillus paranthracis]